MVISSTFWLLDITDWWCQWEGTYTKYANLSNVAWDIFSIIAHGIWLVARFFFERNAISWKQWNPTSKTLHENVIVRQFARADTGTLGGSDLAMDTMETEYNLELNREAKERKLHRMAKVHNKLKIWQSTQILCAIQKESRVQKKQMTAVWCISDIEETIKTLWSTFRHDGVAAFTLPERPPLPPALTAMDFPAGWTQVLVVCWINRIDCYPVKSDDDSAHESISDIKIWLSWNSRLDNPNVVKDFWEADDKTNVVLDNGISNPKCPEHQVISMAPTVPRLIQPKQRAIKMAEKGFKLVSAMETWRNKGHKTK